jgi:hypothetical protein
MEIRKGGEGDRGSREMLERCLGRRKYRFALLDNITMCDKVRPNDE